MTVGDCCLHGDGGIRHHVEVTVLRAFGIELLGTGILCYPSHEGIAIAAEVVGECEFGVEATIHLLGSHAAVAVDGNGVMEVGERAGTYAAHMTAHGFTLAVEGTADGHRLLSPAI